MWPFKKKIKLFDIDPDNYHITMKEFIECVEDGTFMDYDGWGYYATEDKVSKIAILPSDIGTDAHRKDFTHVVWFNR